MNQNSHLWSLHPELKPPLVSFSHLSLSRDPYQIREFSRMQFFLFSPSQDRNLPSSIRLHMFNFLWTLHSSHTQRKGWRQRFLQSSLSLCVGSDSLTPGTAEPSFGITVCSWWNWVSLSSIYFLLLVSFLSLVALNNHAVANTLVPSLLLSGYCYSPANHFGHSPSLSEQTACPKPSE